jgi:Effector Associated Constant Component 1
VGSADISVEFSVSDPAEVGSLSRWLERDGKARVERTPAMPVRGELGVADILASVGSSGAVVAAIQLLPDFIRSRRPGFRIEATVKGKPFVLDAKNADEQVVRMAERILDTVLSE